MIIKRKLKTLNNKTGQKIISKIKRMIDIAERYKSCFFWNNTGSASSRRKQEFEDILEFNLAGNSYKWEQSLEISCRNFYFTNYITFNGKKSNVTRMKGLIK